MISNRLSNDVTGDAAMLPFPKKSAWLRFGLPLGIFTAIEVIAILSGLCFLPYIKGFMGYICLPTWFAGQFIEMWLIVQSGNWLVTSKQPLGPIDRRFSRGTMYIVPPLYAITGRILGWAVWISLLMYIGLMIHVYIGWSRRVQ